MSINYGDIAQKVRSLKPKVQYFYATKFWAMTHRDEKNVRTITPNLFKTLGVPDDDWAPAHDTDVALVEITGDCDVNCYGNLVMK